ncbi:RNase3 domain protein [Ostertagia ostertagi]
MITEKDVELNCFTPRDYQVELLDKACKRNVIVQLGTGAGKTFIAVLLLKEYGLQIMAPFESGGKRAFFVVDKVALVDQQAEHIQCHTTLTVGRMHGSLNSDVWNKQSGFDEFMSVHNVVVITAQVFLDLIDHAYFNIAKLALVIFDECHHALGVKHPYRVIMDRIMRVPAAEQPRILGLTASLINDKTPPNQLEAKLSKLECVLNSAIETASDLVAISKYGAKPNEYVVISSDYNPQEGCGGEILQLLEDWRKFCSSTQEFDPNFDIDPRKPIQEALNRTLAVLRQVGPWAAWKVSQMWEKELHKLTKQSFLQEKTVDFLIMGETCMTTVRKMLEPKMKPIKSLEGLKPYLPNKVVRLIDILSHFNPDKGNVSSEKEEQLSGIIFVDQRYVAYTLNVLLKHVCRWEADFKFIQSDFVIGFSGGSFASDDSQGLHKRQADVIRRFRQGELNLLVATSVLEEGVDVRHCNLVIKFDRPIDYRSYIQSKGRARKRDGGAKYFILVDKSDSTKCSEDLRDFVKIEKMLLRRCRSVHNPGNDGDNEVGIAENVDTLIPPYVVPSTGAQVSLSSAIGLVNRYCAKLPSDIFTRLVPQSRLNAVNFLGKTLYKAELLLPINSPVKQPIALETPLESKKLAQMAVALEACRVLHQAGELNDHLLPVGRESIAELLSQLDEDPDEWAPGISAKVATALHEALPVKGEPCYIYVMELELLKEPSPESNPKRRRFANPLEYEYLFGFLSSKILPKIPSFAAYLRQGDMRVHLVRASTQVTLNSQNLTMIKHFHHYIFKNVLQLCKANLDFHLDSSTPINTLIVPLRRTASSTNDKWEYSINMKYVEEVVQMMGDTPRIPSEEERRNFVFRPEDYRDAVVMPWYRNIEQPVFYYVAEILENLTPSSPFPDEEYSSFNEYFIKKYNLEIYDQKQNLLDVDFTSNRLNLLLPRAGGGRRKTAAAKPEDNSALSRQRQIYVPELMDRHPISATLWNLISALPSFFYRINHLLLADELRQKTLVDALGYSKVGFGLVGLYFISLLAVDIKPFLLKEDAIVPDNYEWTPLSYPATYEEKQSLIVTKIQQLREQNRATEIAAGKLTKDQIEAENTFEVGVWEPVVVELNNDENIPPASFAAGDSLDTVGLMSSSVRTGGDLSDDDDADAVMMFDFSKYLAEKAGATKSDFAAPRPDIQPIGWGGFDDSVPDTPFLYLDKMEMLEDRERAQKEEIVDLMQFDEGDDMDCSTAVECCSDDEYAQLEDGERQKYERDHSVVINRKLSEGEIIAPELPSWQNRFSFASASLSSTCLVSNGTVSLDYHSESLLKENPYGVSPRLLLTALTTSNANDGINLERLETIGDSFLKYSVTDYLYHSHPDQHEGKLSFARSKEVSNCNLYRLGKRLGIPSLIVASKFDVYDSWLPPCYMPNNDFKAPNSEDAEERDKFIEDVLEGNETAQKLPKPVTGWDQADLNNDVRQLENGVETTIFAKPSANAAALDELPPLPYNIFDRAHLLTLGPRPTLKVMKWLGLKVLTDDVVGVDPLLKFVNTPECPNMAERLLQDMWQQFNFSLLEDRIGYRFNNKAYLIQAFTHASYFKNRITGCYQRLEFLGDAVLDYMITRYLFEDERQYSPGVLTDLRSALVNNTIFASLAVKYDFHKHFIAMCPGLHHMIEKFVKLCSERNFFDANFNSEMYMVTTEEEIDEGQEEDIEVPKAMSDIFESVAGAVYLDANRDLDIVWRVFFNLMRQTIEECCAYPPRSPIRELMELEPGKTRFRLAHRFPLRNYQNGTNNRERGKVRVTVDIGNKIKFTGMGRNYRIAKTTAAKRALKYLKSLEEQKLREAERNVTVTN